MGNLAEHFFVVSNFNKELRFFNLFRTMAKTLWIWESLPKKIEENADKSWLGEGDAVENVHRLEMGGHQPGTFANINSGARFPQTIQHNLDLLDLIGKLAQPGGKIKIVQAVGNAQGLVAANKLVSNVKLAGLVAVQAPKFIELNPDQLEEIKGKLELQPDAQFLVAEIECTSPHFANGSSTPLSFAAKIKKPEKKSEKIVWSLADDDDVDLMDEDELLEEEDLKRPDQASLKVCGTTGKRKACKNCACGLAEELEGKKPAPNKITSSCGSCYLGDAFRCASCPYLGMPAFKPGDKIQLSERQLKADQ